MTSSPPEESLHLKRKKISIKEQSQKIFIDLVFFFLQSYFDEAFALVYAQVCRIRQID